MGPRFRWLLDLEVSQRVHFCGSLNRASLDHFLLSASVTFGFPCMSLIVAHCPCYSPIYNYSHETDFFNVCSLKILIQAKHLFSSMSKTLLMASLFCHVLRLRICYL